jgi:hypothetical protein
VLKKRRLPQGPPPLTIDEILALADAHSLRTGELPGIYSGAVQGGSLGENWRKIDNALRYGLRGLEGKSSLAQLLAERRGIRNHMRLPRLSTALILRWADAFRKATGNWPHIDSGAIPESTVGDTWKDIDLALRIGARGLRSGRSLPQILAKRRGVRNLPGTPSLTVDQILAWADEWHSSTGRWPLRTSGEIKGQPGETWAAVDAALASGCRGLPGNSSLPQLLHEHRGVRNKASLPRLTKKQIRVWAESHHRRTGRYATPDSGSIADAPGETWKAVQMALVEGLRVAARCIAGPVRGWHNATR